MNRAPHDPDSSSTSARADGLPGSEKGRLLLAAFGYLLLAIIFTWPLAAHLRTEVLGYAGFENTQQTLWLYTEWKAYVAAAARDLLGAGGFLSPRRWFALWWTVASFAPKVSMANGIDFAITWPLEVVFGTPGYYNVKCLLILTLNGLSLFALLRALEARPLAAWLGGVAFAFNPFAFYLLLTGRLIESMQVWSVLYALSLWKVWFDAPRRFAWSIAAGVTFGLSTLTFWFNGHFMLVYTLLFCTYQTIRGGLHGPRALSWTRFLGISVAAIIALAVVAPAAAPYMVTIARNDEIPGGARGRDEDARARFLVQIMAWSCDAGYGLAPPRAVGEPPERRNPPWLLPTIHTFEPMLTLCAIASLFLLGREQRFWALAFVFLYTLPLGPLLKANGALVTWGGAPVSLPYDWMLRGLPLLDRFLFPSESMWPWVMTVGVVIGLGCDRLMQVRPALASTYALLLVVAAVDMGFQDQIPLPKTPLTPPPVYASATEGFIYLPANVKFWLQQDDGRPDSREFYVEPDLKHVDFHMALHGRKSLWGRNQYLAGADIWMFQPKLSLSNTYLRTLLSLEQENRPFTRDDLRRVRAAGLRYVVLMERLCAHQAREGDYTVDLEAGAKRYAELSEKLEALFGPPVHEGPDATWDKYIVPDGVKLQPYRLRVYDSDTVRVPATPRRT